VPEHGKKKGAVNTIDSPKGGDNGSFVIPDKVYLIYTYMMFRELFMLPYSGYWLKILF
jgi:hypothetical protein